MFFWLLYMATEYIANLPHLSGVEHIYQLRAILLTIPILAIPTYVYVYYGIPKLLKENKIVLFIILILLSAVFVLVARLKWLEIVNYINYGYSGKMPVTKVFKNVIRDYAMIALAICIYIIADWRRKSALNEAFIKEKAATDLELLKRQLHPHFLFNTLNNIYSLALKNSDNTGESILKLSRLLEFLVYRSNDNLIALKEELELINNYIDLEKLRYGDQLKIEFDTKNIHPTVQISPLMILPFVENCFKHGGKNKEGVFWIHMNVNLHNNTLEVFLKNSKPHRKKSAAKPAGIGLENCRKRLDLAYRDAYKLQIEDSLHYFEVKLFIHLAYETG